MLTLALYGLLAIALMGGLFLLAVRFLPAGEQIAPALRDEPVWTLPPDRSLTAADIADLRLPVALRGYRFAETDELLDRVVEELRKRDEQLDHLYRVLIALPPDVIAGLPSPPEGESSASVVPPASIPAGAAAGSKRPRWRRVARKAPQTAVPGELGAAAEPLAEAPLAEEPSDQEPLAQEPVAEEAPSDNAPHGG